MLLLALGLHGGLAMWFDFPAPAPLPERPEQVVRINLLAAVAETVTHAPTPVAKPPPPEPVIPEPQPEPPPQPKPIPALKPVPMPEIQELPEKQEPEIEPEPEFTPVQKPVPPPDAVATARYEQLLVAWLEKHKQYPRRAKRLRIEGEGRLRILINSKGQLQNVTLDQTTGNRLLDKAALQMVHRADPFPPMPESDARHELEFIVPVVFALR